MHCQVCCCSLISWPLLSAVAFTCSDSGKMLQDALKGDFVLMIDLKSNKGWCRRQTFHITYSKGFFFTEAIFKGMDTFSWNVSISCIFLKGRTQYFLKLMLNLHNLVIAGMLVLFCGSFVSLVDPYHLCSGFSSASLHLHYHLYLLAIRFPMSLMRRLIVWVVLRFSIAVSNLKSLVPSSSVVCYLLIYL